MTTSVAVLTTTTKGLVNHFGWCCVWLRIFDDTGMIDDSGGGIINGKSWDPRSMVHCNTRKHWESVRTSMYVLTR